MTRDDLFCEHGLDLRHCPLHPYGGKMTRDEINREVAEKVMGWYVTRNPYGGGPELWLFLEPPETHEDYYCLAPIHRLNDWNPAERIDHAWMVVEKLNSEGGCFSLINDDDGHWACVSDGEQPAYGKFVGSTTFEIERDDQWADTAPMAICLAALKAKEGK